MSTQTLDPPVSVDTQPKALETAQPGSSMQLVSFRLGHEEYGIEITNIQEIILMGDITRVPQTPAYIKGLINLRSTVIPIVDLRSRFGLTEVAPTDETRIIVVNMSGKTTGIVVDAVSEVLRIGAEQIATPPARVAGQGNKAITGLVKMEQRLLILLEIERIFSEEESSRVNAIAAQMGAAQTGGTA